MTRMLGRCTLAVLLLALVAGPKDIAAQRRARGGGVSASGLDHRIELSGWGGWQFGGTISADYNSNSASLHTPADVNYGAGLGFRIGHNAVAEVVWNQQRTELQVTDRATLPDSTLFPLTIHYVQFMSQLEKQGGRTRPFVTGGLGVAIFDPDSSSLSDETRFSIGFGAGVKSYVNDRVGIRMQLRGWVTLIGAGGGGLWCGGAGCVAAVSGYGFFQGDVSGGLFLAF